MSQYIRMSTLTGKPQWPMRPMIIINGQPYRPYVFDELGHRIEGPLRFEVALSFDRPRSSFVLVTSGDRRIVKGNILRFVTSVRPRGRLVYDITT